jgi:uncharacterized coiled-coil DUF342 family protein
MKENVPTSSLKTAKPYPEYITMRDCLKLDLKDAIAQRDSLQDQRDFAMSEMERLKRERDEAREAFAIAIDNCTGAQQSLRQARDRCWKLGLERNHWKRESHEQSQAPLAPSS